MQSLIGIILQVVLLLWKHKGKTTFAAVLAVATGGGTYVWMESQRPEPEVQAFHGAPGVPSGGGVNPNNAPEDGEFLKWVDPTGAEWAAGGAGASALPDLSDVAGTLTGDNGDILSFDGTDWDDLTLEEVFTAGIGNGTDNYVLTTDGAGVIAWEAASGGAGITYENNPTDAQLPVWDDTNDVYVATQAGAPVYSVKNPISYDPPGSPTARMVRAAGSMQSTTGTIDVGADANEMTVAASWDGARGHGIKVLGAGAAHGLSAPATAAVIPMTLDRTVGNSDAAVTFTTAHNATASLERIVTSEQISVPDGTIVRLSNQGGTLPTYVTTTAFVEGTAYYWRNRYEIQTIAISGSPTGGTYRIFDGDDPLSSVSVAYNASSATLQTALRTLTGWGSVTVSESGSTPNFTHTITMTGLPGNRRIIGVDARGMTGGTPIIGLTTTASGGGMLYPTALDATSDTNAYDIDGAGTGTHYIIFEGATSYEYDACGLSGAFGWTDDGTDATTTTGHTTLNAQVPNRVFVDCVTNTKGGYAIMGNSTTDGDRFIHAVVNECPTAIKITPDGGFTPLEYGDFGRTLVQGTHDGRIVGFDNSIPAIWVDPSVPGTDTFPGGAAVAWTITSGAGSGTQTAAGTNAVYWDDCGPTATYSKVPDSWDTFACGPYRRVGRMSSTIYKPGEWMAYPLSSSAVWYLCVESQSIPNSSGVRGNKTAASAPSFNTGYGQTTRDGDITWLRIDRPCPTTLPSAAVADALDTTVTAVSGTTITVADAATTSVTSSPVLHDDTWAALAHYSVVRDSNQIVRFEWGEGRFPIYSGVIGTDANLTTLGNDTTLFPCYPSSGQLVQRTLWDMGGASIFWMPGDVTGELFAPTDTMQFMLLSKAYQHIDGPGRFICAGVEPHLEHHDAWNACYWSRSYSSGDNEIAGPYLNGISVLGYSSALSWNLEPNNEDIAVIRDCHFDYGYSGHDLGIYLGGGLISGGSLQGMRGFDCSVAIYQDFQNNQQSLTLTDGFYGAYWRQNGFRIRQSDVKIHGCRFWMCQQLFVSETIEGLSILGNHLDYTDIDLGADANTHIADNVIRNGTLAINTASINPHVHDNDIWFDPSFYTPTGSTRTAFTMSGTDANIHHNTIDARGRGFTVSAVTTTGTGTRAIFDTNVVKGASGSLQLLTVNSPSCNLKITNNEIRSEFSTNTSNYIQNAGTLYYKDNRWWNPTGTLLYDIDAGGDITIDGDESSGSWDFGSTITGPIRIKNARFQSATATVIAEPSTLIEATNFAAAPTLSGATLGTLNNSVADAKVLSPSALGTTSNDLALGVTDTHRLDPNAANTVLSSIVARAGGTTITIICVDAGAATLTLLDDDGATGTAANRIVTPDGADIVLSNNETVVLQYDATATRWKVIGGGYSAIFNRDAQRAFEGSWVLAA